MFFSQNLETYLIIAAFLFVTGIYGMIQHRSFVGMLISTELVLNSSALNFMAFNRFLSPDPAIGQVFTLFIMGIAAAEVAIAISMVLAVYRRYRSDDPEDVNKMKH
ncbi:MAG: NADH-quinone oxidoreductase subunit NuoK [Deltaproteobacteria bacterium]|nr:MAG: NADH-quinone oxidoreductase subunit NuoK [Deltaproteobacteria bacterium]